MFAKTLTLLVFFGGQQNLIWCIPYPQQGTGGVQVSLNAGANQRPQMSPLGMQYQGNPGTKFAIPFAGSLLHSVGSLGSSALTAPVQTASHLMDGMSYSLSRVPAVVGYGVQSAGQLQRASEQMFKAAVDLGTGGVTHGMQGMALGMNVMHGLGNAGMTGINKVATGSSEILQHILSLGATESGLINALTALTRLMSPALGTFLSSGLNMNSLMNAASYLGIPGNNTHLNTILNAASSLQGTLANSGINMESIASAANATANAVSNINYDSVKQAAAAAVNNLGLSTAWNILSSRLSGTTSNTGQAVPAVANSNAALQVPAVKVNVSTGAGSRSAAVGTDSASSWTNWFG
uniref:Uncharacterized protein n=1 Tax=Cacopsylla melanoneura TaxID=428564 RepID=A0A8D8Y0D3_9HEMI